MMHSLRELGSEILDARHGVVEDFLFVARTAIDTALACLPHYLDDAHGTPLGPDDVLDHKPLVRSVE